MYITTARNFCQLKNCSREQSVYKKHFTKQSACIYPVYLQVCVFVASIVSGNKVTMAELSHHHIIPQKSERQQKTGILDTDFSYSMFIK